MVLFLKIALVSYFSIIDIETNNLPIVKLTPKSRIYFIIIMTLTDFFNILTNQKYIFLIFFITILFKSNIIFLIVVEKIIIVKLGKKLSFTRSYLSNLTFLDIVSLFSFSIY